MGSGIGNSIGQQLAHGQERPVISICGDGSISMVGNELATCVKHQIPVLFAVLNDGRYGMVVDGESRVYGRGREWKLPPFDLVAWARALGAEALRIESHEALVHAVQSARELPLVLDIPIDPSVTAGNPRDLTVAFPRDGTEAG
jgi:thiamine pyrophosphate-dependent acetolactate synthase large subunit-like protein